MLESEESAVAIPPPADESVELGVAPLLRADSLADSVVILLALTGVQRLVGLCRAVLFCRWLPPEELGQWDMAFSFLMLVGPLSVLALPGSFGRYLEYYRRRGHLRTLLARTLVAAAILVTATSLVLWLGRTWFAVLIFGSSRQAGFVGLLAGSLGIIVSTHYLIELLTARRNVRLLAVVQFVNSLAFAVFGAVLVLGWSCDARSIVLAYTASCLLSTLLVLWWLRPVWRGLSAPRQRLPQRAFWAKILPFVAWLTTTNLLASLFDIADRYMIIQYSPEGPDRALEIVGQYHSSRVVPLLMISIALMLGSMITPYLSHDWEQGLRERVKARFNLFLKLLAFALCGGAAAIVLASPLLFDWALAGKFNAGREVLPLTLAYCIWFGLTIVAQNYLFCVERARLGSLALLVGLAVNVILNRLLLPVYGLPGAVTATAAANLVALGLIVGFNGALGFRPDGATLVLFLMPALFVLDSWVAPVALGLLVALAFSTRWVLSAEERGQLAAVWRDYAGRLRGGLGIGD